MKGRHVTILDTLQKTLIIWELKKQNSLSTNQYIGQVLTATLKNT